MNKTNIFQVTNFMLTIILGIWIIVDHGDSSPISQLNVEQIRVVEPDGTLRMVISNHAKFPGIIVRGKEEPFDRAQAGMLFYNDEGSENGGLIFGGKRNEKGEIVNSGGSLTFDKYDANQEVQLMGVNDSELRYAGLLVNDSHVGGDTQKRLRVGRRGNGNACLELMDSLGVKRLELVVTSNGKASINFLDNQGRITKSIVGEAN